MRFSCEKAVLAEVVDSASRAVSSKSTIAALEGILLRADSGISATGYDLEVGILSTAPAYVETKGSIIINSRLLSDIVRKLPDSTVTVESDDKLYTTISCGPSVFNLIGLNPSDFPELPAIQREHSTQIPQNILRSMISGTIFSASSNENRPILTGCLFKLVQDTLEIAALDNFRVAIRRENVVRDAGSENLSFVVPAKALREIERMTEDTDDPVSLLIGSRHIQFSCGNTVLTSRLLEGEFLNYNNAIPKNSPNTFTADVSDLISSLERVSLIINEKLKNYVKCAFSDSLLQLSCTTAIGKAYDECALKQLTGGELEIGFNSRYLLEALRACKEEEVLLECSTSLAPFLIKPLEGDQFLYLILPVRLKNEA